MEQTVNEQRPGLNPTPWGAAGSSVEAAEAAILLKIPLYLPSPQSSQMCFSKTCSADQGSRSAVTREAFYTSRNELLTITASTEGGKNLYHCPCFKGGETKGEKEVRIVVKNGARLCTSFLH